MIFNGRKVNISLANNPKRVCVIGSGSIGNKHLLTLRETFPQCELVSVPSRPRDDYHSPIADICCSTIAQGISLNPDFAIIASPATLHLEHVREFAQANIPMLIEKPLTTTAQDSMALIQLLNKHQVAAAVGYCLRQLPALAFVQEVLANNTLGKIVTVSAKVAQYLPLWRPDSSYQQTVSAQKALGGGVLLELSHELDLASLLFGKLTALHSVLINSGALNVDVEEVAHLSLKAKCGAVLNIELNFLQQQTERWMTITGEHGTISCNWLTNEVMLVAGENSKEFKPSTHWHNSQIYALQLRQFVEFVRHGQSNLASPSEAFGINQLIDQIRHQASLNTGNNE